MRSELTVEQEMVRAATVRFAESVCPVGYSRDVRDRGCGLPEGYLTTGGSLGWFSFLVPEQLGGGAVSGAGVVDSVLVAEVRGRSLQPGPFTTMNVVAVALARGGSKRHQTSVLPAVLGGESIATWAVADSAGNWEGPAGAVIEDHAGGWSVTGCKTMVPYAEAAEWLLVTARHADGISQVFIPRNRPGIRVEEMGVLDFGTRLARIDFDRVEVCPDEIIGAPERAEVDVGFQLDVAALLTTAEIVGGIDELLGRTIEYVKSRIAFGRPVGSFQAVKHQIADASLKVEMSKAVLGEAARGADRAGGSLNVSAAKSFVGEAALDVTETCFQLFGGIGYTWEHDLHLFLRRINSSNRMFGDPAWHRERVLVLGGIDEDAS